MLQEAQLRDQEWSAAKTSPDSKIALSKLLFLYAIDYKADCSRYLYIADLLSSHKVISWTDSN